MKARAKQIILAMGAVFLAGVAPRAGEQVEFKGSTSVELPKPKRPLDDNRRMRMDPERPSVEGGLSTSPPIDSSPLSNKKLREALDKKKNWIFVNPYEQHFDSKTEEFMQGEKSTGLYDNHWMDSKEEKTAVQKFMEEKDRPKQGERGTGGKDDLPDRGQSTRETLSQGRTDELETKREENLSVGLPKSEFEKSIFQSGGSLDPFRSSTFDKNFDKSLPGENPFAKPLVNSPEKEDLKQRGVDHEREFNQIITTRLGSGNPGGSIGRLDNLQVGGGVGQLDLRGGGGGSLNLGRGLGSGPSTVTFTDGGPSLGARPTFDGRSFGGDFSVAPKAAPSYAPAPQTPVAQRSSGSATPFSLPFPQRKF